MSAQSLPFAAVLLGSLPAGYLAALFARRLASHPAPSVLAMIGICAAAGLWAALVMPHNWLLAISCGLGWALIVLATVDGLAFRLPDVLTIPLIVAGIGVSLLLPDGDAFGHLAAAAIAIAVFYGIAVAYRHFRGVEGLGMGDMKLVGAAGAWLGWQALPYVVLLASAVGLVWVGIATMRRGRAGLQERIPFGIGLCLAIWVIWLYGPPDLVPPVY